MQRKRFLCAVAAATAGITASAAGALGATPVPYATPFPGFSPQPGRSPRPGSSVFPANTFHRHGAARRPSGLEHIHRHLERLIGMLEQYPQTHSDHVAAAINFLQQADTEIVNEMSTASPAPAL